MATIETKGQPIDVKVIRYRIAAIRFGQTLLPFTIIASIFARRSLDPTAVSLAVGLQLATLVSFLSARRGLGVQSFSVEKGKGLFGAQLVLARARVLRWTVSGNVVRLYCSDISLRLACRTQDSQLLVDSLTGWLGRPIQLKRRGSDKARLRALVAASVGMACTVAAFILQNVALVVVGLPIFVIGLAVFGALSQQVAQS